MVVLCEGRRGDGFYLCGACGAGFRKRELKHRTPQGQECNGTLDQVSLGHEFVTDVLQPQFRSAPRSSLDRVWFTFSLAYALAEGAAEVLEVPSINLSTTVAHSDQLALPPNNPLRQRARWSGAGGATRKREDPKAMPRSRPEEGWSELRLRRKPRFLRSSSAEAGRRFAPASYYMGHA